MVGDKIKSIRNKKGMSQQEVAERAEISYEYLNKIENSKKGNPSYKVLIKIADALGVSINEFFSEKPIDEINKMVKDSGINTIAAHFEGEEFTKEDKEDIKNFIEYILSKKKNK